MYTFSVGVRTVPAPPVVTIAGEIDIANVEELRDRVLAVADGDVVLDISGVRLLAAAGVGALLDLHHRHALAGSQMVIASAGPLVRRVLAVTEVDTVLLMAATVDEAINMVAGTPRDGRNAPYGKSAGPRRSCHSTVATGPLRCHRPM